MNRVQRSMCAWWLSACMTVSAVPLPAMAAEADQSEQSVIAAEDMSAFVASVSGNQIESYSLTQEIPIDEAHFPDAVFRKYVEEKFDKDKNGTLSDEERARVIDISCTEMEISDLTGIEFFGNLQYLYCGGNQLGSLDVSGNPALKELRCYGNQLGSLDVSGNPALENLNCYGNQLSSLNVSENPALKTLCCFWNQLSSLDVSRNPALEELGCERNQLSSLDVSGALALERLYCYGNQLSSLDVSGNPTLKELECYENQLSSLDVSGNPALEVLRCYENQLSSLDVSGNPALEILSCEENVYSLPCLSNNIYDLSDLSRTYDLSKLPGNFDVSRASGWKGGSVKGNTLIVNTGTKKVTYIYDVDGRNGDKAVEFTLKLSTQDIPIDEFHFPDETFRWHVNSFDMDRDGTLSDEERAGVIKISCDRIGISDLTGIEFFGNLEELYCYENQLSSLDVSRNPALKKLECGRNQLSSLDVSRNPALKKLECGRNQLSSLDVSGNPALEYLGCNSNHLSSLNMSGNPALKKLECGWNQLSSLDVSRNPALEYLYCSRNQLSSLDVSGNPALEYLECYENQLSSLDVSGNPALKALYCGKNQLSSLDVSGNPALEHLSCPENPLSSLDVSGNPALWMLAIHDNVYSLPRSSDNTYDLSKLPGNFDVSRASDWQGGSVKGNILTVNAGTEWVSYMYNIDGSNGGRAAEFTLNIIEGQAPDPHTHSYDTGKITKAATCKEEGVKTYTCTVCGVTKTEKIPKAAHTYETTRVKATLKKDGKNTTACKVCGKVKSTKSISRPASIALKKTSYTYNGKVKKPGVVVKDAAGKTIGSSNYRVSYEKGRKNIGKYKVTVTFKGNYSGTRNLSFTINPPATKLSSVAAGRKKLIVKWKMQNQATGYEIQYSTSKNFKKNAVKTVNIKKKAIVNKTITGLKAKKTYYVRIRAYKTVSGKKYYSAWSSIQKAVTKK